MKKVSIIIPLKEINDYVKEAVDHIELLDYPKDEIEVIVLPDKVKEIQGKFSFTLRIIETGHIFPGEKRDIGIKESTGQIIAFIDDDVFPQKQWLKKAVEIFESDGQVGAVGGPAATPESDSFMQKVSGYIYSSLMGGGGYRYRYMPEKQRLVDDYPSCNLMVRKDVLDKIGGFNTEFWPGEDTVICLKIVHGLNLKIVYDPDVFVYHHRRKFFSGHIKQVKNYALHRGYFVKRFPKTSLRPGYFVPTAFVAYLLSFIYPGFFKTEWLLFWGIPLGLYAILLLIDGMLIKSIKHAPVVIFGIIINHLYYGVYFIKGLLKKRLKEEELGPKPKA